MTPGHQIVFEDNHFSRNFIPEIQIDFNKQANEYTGIQIYGDGGIRIDSEAGYGGTIRKKELRQYEVPIKAIK